MKENIGYILGEVLKNEEMLIKKKNFLEFIYVLDKYREVVPLNQGTLNTKFCPYTRKEDSLYFENAQSLLVLNKDEMNLLFKKENGVEWDYYSIIDNNNAIARETMFDTDFLKFYEIDADNLKKVYEFGKEVYSDSFTDHMDVLADKMIGYDISKRKRSIEIFDNAVWEKVNYRIKKECFLIKKVEYMVNNSEIYCYKDHNNSFFEVLDEVRVDFLEQEKKTNRFYMKKLGTK